jgi:hypothetical protein
VEPFVGMECKQMAVVGDEVASEIIVLHSRGSRT